MAVDPDVTILGDYRRQVQELASKSQEDFDKTVLTLAGGALGISLVFIKDVVGGKPLTDPNFLFWAWLCWGSSTTATLVSHLTSHWAHKRTVRQVNTGTIRSERPGGFWSPATSFLNIAAAVLYLAGLILLVLFAKANFQTSGEKDGSTQASVAAATPAAAASAASAASSSASASAAPPVKASGGKQAQ